MARVLLLQAMAELEMIVKRIKIEKVTPCMYIDKETGSRKNYSNFIIRVVESEIEYVNHLPFPVSSVATPVLTVREISKKK